MDEFEKALEREEIKEYNWFQKIVIFSAGAKPGILMKCRSEDGQVFVVGGAVMLTTAAALISGSYAFTMLFNGQGLAILLGVFWATIIYNMDRSIIIGLGKSYDPEKKKHGDAKYRFFIAGSVLFRLCIAVFIAFVVDLPLEIRIFQKELSDQRSKLATTEMRVTQDSIYQSTGISGLRKDISGNNAALQKVNDQIAHIVDDPAIISLKTTEDKASSDLGAAEAKYSPLIAQEKSKIEQHQADLIATNDQQTIKQIQAQIQAEQNLLKSYQNVLGTFSSIEGKALHDYNAAYKAKFQPLNANRRLLLSQIKNDSTKVVSTTPVANEKILSRDTAINVKYDNNLVAQINALNDLKADKTDGQTYSNIGWGIRGVIILIELLPIFLKIFSSKGSYERQVATFGYMNFVDEQRKRRLKDDEYKAAVAKHEEIINIRMQVEIDKENLLASERDALIKKTVKMVTAFQNKLINKYISAWYLKEDFESEKTIEEYLKDVNRKK